MGTVHSIERRQFVRRQADRGLASQSGAAALVAGETRTRARWIGVESGRAI